MIYKPLYILVFLFFINAYSQNTKDVSFIKDMSYLESANLVNCDSTSGSNLEQRICLNIKLRRIDSLMLSKFHSTLREIESDSLKNVFRENQTNWEIERKSISMHKSDGLESNVGANMFMHYMIKLTELRILTLNYILEEN
ncbi:hypothetical protein [Winogradskyella sp.]|uniref:hypothetical protein n=1 Tax=Winogradskyella sp. TaxID=1883156 RepID=UPI0026028116|nr:hypothetical protein [Winogradskyella sp.]